MYQIIKKILNHRIIRASLIIFIFVFAISSRLPYFMDSGKDVSAYERAVTELLTGKNPYLWTIESFSNPDDPSNHGYAYLPGLLYLQSVLYLIHLLSGLPKEVLWKIPVLICDIGVGLMFAKMFFKKDYLFCLFSILFWFFNPYNVTRNGYSYFDTIPIFLMFVSLIYLDKDSVLSGVFFALSVLFKTFPAILFPLYLLRTNKPRQFLLSVLIVGVFFSFPFMGNFSSFLTYLQGAILVHGGRFVQGRPFLFYISYYYNIELFQILPFKFYSLMSMLFGWVVILFSYFVLKIKDKYLLALLSFLNFYLFTPVLNRTYILWFLPVFLLGIYGLFKRKYISYIIFCIFYVFMSWYLIQWEDGFHIWRP